MSWYILINLILQAAAQTMFLVLYFRSHHLWRDSMILMAVFVFILGPLNLLATDLVIRNITNVAILFFVLKILYSKTGLKRIVLGLLQYEMTLIIIMFLTMIVLSAFFPGLMAGQDQDSVAAIILYFAASVLIFVMMSISLSLSNRIEKASSLLGSVLLILFLNLGLILLSFGCTFWWSYTDSFEIDYGLTAVLVSILNVIALSRMIQAVKKDSQKRAMERIYSVYAAEVSDLLEDEKKEEEIRRLRHDLINFNERINASQSRPKPNIETENQS